LLVQEVEESASAARDWHRRLRGRTRDVEAEIRMLFTMCTLSSTATPASSRRAQFLKQVTRNARKLLCHSDMRCCAPALGAESICSVACSERSTASRPSSA
jgi:hypothetical protein